jgi:hypothetical protein
VEIACIEMAQSFRSSVSNKMMGPASASLESLMEIAG